MAYRSFNNISLAQRLPITFSSAQALGRPSPTQIGVNSGFIMPVYNNDNQEVFFTLKVPRRWDKTTNPTVIVFAHLGNTEDVGDKFQFQLSYVCNGMTGVLSATTNDVPVETTVVEGRAAQYDRYPITFTLDATKFGTDGCEFKARLRRVASGSPAVSNSPIVTSAYITFKRDKLGVSHT